MHTITTADDRRTVARSRRGGQLGLCRETAKVAPGARVDDGELDLVVVEERSRLATFCRAPRLFTGSLAGAGGYSTRRIREATIESSAPMIFHVDGEPIMGGTRLDARVHPGALKICVK